MMFVSLGIGVVLAALLIGAVSLLTSGRGTSGSASTPTSALVGTTAKGFELGGLFGGVVRSPWTQGRPSVLIFFASDCGPCRHEMPLVASYVRRHHLAPVSVVGVDVVDARAAAQRFVRQDGVTFPVAFDPTSAVTTGIFGFMGIPETVFLNGRGVVTNVYSGAIPPAQLASGIRRLRSTT